MKTLLKIGWPLVALIGAAAFGHLRAAEQPTAASPQTVRPKTNPDRDATSDKARAPQDKVELNTASPQELEALPGIGPVTAKAIIEARPFKSVNDLTNVTGISQVKLATLKPLVTVRPSRAATAAGKPTPVEPGSARSGTSTDVGKSTPAERGSASSRGSTSTSRPASQRVDLNSATKEELESLPGIGPVRAQAIIDGRPYAKPEDVMKVKGIKQGIYDEIKDQINVR